MRLGLLADIHEAVEPLSAAIRELNARQVDAFVVLGDILDRGERVEETVALLTALPGAAVWGNHDFGLCGDVAPSTRTMFAHSTLEYFARLRATVDLEGCRFQHIDPHLDPGKFEDLWRFPNTDERIAGLGRISHSRVFVGHLHRWGIFTPAERIAWEGEAVFRYRIDQRYLTVVHAVAEGWCATLDTVRDELEPVRVA